SRRTPLFAWDGECGVLPARLRHAGNETMRSHFAEGDPGHLETAQVAAAASGHFTAVDQPGGAGIARQHGETFVVLFRLELLTKLGVFGYGARLALITGDPTLFCHGGAGTCALSDRIQAENEQFSSSRDQPLCFPIS